MYVFLDYYLNCYTDFQRNQQAENLYHKILLLQSFSSESDQKLFIMVEVK